jgi:hypothetical protein
MAMVSGGCAKMLAVLAILAGCCQSPLLELTRNANYLGY